MSQHDVFNTLNIFPKINDEVFFAHKGVDVHAHLAHAEVKQRLFYDMDEKFLRRYPLPVFSKLCEKYDAHRS